MPVSVTIDRNSGPHAAGTSLFAVAERLGRCPHSPCDQHGKCRECVLEVCAGEALLTPRVAAEAHLGRRYRLSCCARLAADEGSVVLKTPGRGALRITAEASGLPQTVASIPLAPTVTRAGGLVPPLPDARIASVGNAAIEGAAIALLSVERRAAIERYVRTARRVELETDPHFFDHFVKGCLIKASEALP